MCRNRPARGLVTSQGRQKHAFLNKGFGSIWIRIDLSPWKVIALCRSWSSQMRLTKKYIITLDQRDCLVLTIPVSCVVR